MLGDDAKNPTYILTHPKRGYSLEICPTFSKDNTSYGKWWIFVSATLSIFVVFMFSQSMNSNEEFSGKLEPVTSSAAYDFNPVYSSNGKYLAFIRQVTEANEIVVKDLETGRERIVLSGQKDYQSLTWSFNDEHFYFIIREKSKEWVGQLSFDGTRLARLFEINEPSRIWKVVDNQLYLYLSLIHI